MGGRRRRERDPYARAVIEWRTARPPRYDRAVGMDADSRSFGSDMSTRTPPPAVSLCLRHSLFALCCVAGALLTPGPLRGVVGWLGVSNVALAYAFGAPSPGVFAKRSDGTIGPSGLLLLGPYLIVVRAFLWLKIVLIRPEPCFHEVAPDLFIGRRPRPGELPAGTQVVVDLTAEFPEDPAIVGCARYLCLPILNRHVPSDAALSALLAQLPQDAGVIYVHCGAGRGRSAAVVAALMIRRGLARDVQDAESQLKRIRPGVQLHAIQREQVARDGTA